MTKEQFQSVPEYRMELAAHLGGATGLALSILQAENIPVDVVDGADALASVRELSRRSGYQDCITDLRLLAQAAEPDQEEQPATFLEPPIPETK